MIKAGNKIWTVLKAGFAADNCNGASEFRVEFSGTIKKSAMTFLKTALAEFLYANSNFSHSFAAILAAVNAFVDEMSFTVDDDFLNWRKVDDVKILGDPKLANIVKIQTPRGDIQYKCFKRSFGLVEMFVVQRSNIED